ncbi:ABC transporter [Acrodontium crateriforme]|uniref:ABC transporter n=1 Tax=Acrodontium crateriforme TaxID=150365 RepID=A0AAQ3R6H5_9PEZI|nr:ABC transporter [Acrodontium crateriforme]
MKWNRKKVPESTDLAKEKTTSEKDGEKPEGELCMAADLTESQIELIKGQGDTTAEDQHQAGMFAPYKFASRGELMIVAGSAICSIGSGIPIPLMLVIFGQLVGNVAGSSSISAGSQTSTLLGGNNRNKQVLYMIYLGIAELILTFLSTAGWQYTGRRIARKVRERYFEALLRQNVGFFDTFGTGKVTSHITSDMDKIQESISEKVGLVLRTVATIVAAFVIGFVEYWALALILSSSLIAILLIGGSIAAPMKAWTEKTSEASSEASVVAEETFAAVKTILALNMKKRIQNRYQTHVKLSEAYSWKAKAMLGLLMAATMWIVNLMYGLAFWQGSRFLRHHSGSLDPGGILITLFAITTGSISIAALAPSIQAFVTGAAASAAVFKVINRASPIDVTSEKGIDASGISGDVQLNNIRLVYPSRPDVNALCNFDIHIQAGKTTALVGPSGSGKSSVVGLIERFYNPVEGTITIDGVPAENYNLASLRGQISLVSQEPILFRQSIRDNIAYGLPQARMNALTKDEIDNLVKDAARRAYAMDFIKALPHGFESVVGNQGIALSGGQKQRVAIARAIISDPKILLLDEATAALDTESEKIVQAALSEMAVGRTTVIIAHRLATIRNADSIAVIEGGRVCEQGTHSELIGKGGVYKTLVEAQSVSGAYEEAAIGEPGSPQSLTRKGTHQSDVVNPTEQSGGALQRSTTIKSKTGQEFGDEEIKIPDYSLRQIIQFVYKFNSPERGILAAGFLISIISGLVQPVGAIFFAKSIFSLAAPPGYGLGINFWCAMYLMLAFVCLLALGARGLAFGLCSARLTRRIRLRLFEFYLSQEAPWFDRPENAPGRLTSLLSTEPENVAGVSGATLGTLIDGAVTLIGGCILALAIGWKVALVCISVVPVLLFSGFTNVSMMGKFQDRAKKLFEESASFACEVIAGLRTVASLSREDYAWRLYHEQLYESERKGNNWVLLSSVFYGLSQSTPYFIFALVFWYGGGLVGSGEYSPDQFFIVLLAVIFGAQSAAQFFGFAPDISKARIAGARLLHMFGPIENFTDDDSMNNAHLTLQEKETEEKLSAAESISLRNVTFRYAGLTGRNVLDNISLDVEPGTFVALVGPSGSGKSTIIGLITRNYWPDSGSVTVNDVDIAGVDVSSLRDRMSLVSQEPILFSGTITENIILGLPAESPPVSEEQIIKCCTDANIHEFVSSLPDGYNTLIGNKGVTLSGGQRQRVTIARALLRNPKILLLDEATSALDSTSERLVQAALSRAAEGRTTVAVAHRLSTIRNAKVIFVLDQGRIVEKGTHGELIAKNGLYKKYVEKQDLTKEAGV